MKIRSVAIIGSFRQHNSEIQKVSKTLRTAGFEVTSPQGSEVIEDGISFVRFTSDRSEWTDSEIQSLALHRIFRADIVYVVAPNGYIGRTTCYEVGRIVQSGKPIYFSDFPKDLPLLVHDSFIMSIDDLIENLTASAWQPKWLFHDNDEISGILEQGLLDGKLRHD